MYKRLGLAFLSILCLAVLALAAPTGMTVSTTAVRILPSRPALNGVAWTNGMTVAQGQVVKYIGQLYFAESAGVSTNTPVPEATTARLRHIRSGRRSMAIIQNLGAVDVYLSFSGDAEAAKGLKLVPDAFATLGDDQGPVSAVTASGSATLGISEVTQ